MHTDDFAFEWYAGKEWFHINILVYNQNKTLAMKEANLFFTYVRREFPDSRSIVEDYCDADKLLDAINKAPADIYALSAIGDQKKNCLKLSLEIRARYRSCSILVVVNELENLKQIVNASVTPDYVFIDEVTGWAIEKFFSMQGQQKFQRSLLTFTVDGRKQVVGMQTIISAQAADKKVAIRVLDRTYITALTIADLEQMLPDNFVRIDKGSIINIEYLKNFDSQTESVYLLDGQHFPVSRRGQKRLFEAVGAI